jgi:integrase
LIWAAPLTVSDLGIPADNRSYRAQILRGGKKDPKDGVKISSWHPNQVRHTAADELTAQLGPAAAQARLGHSHLNTTEIDRSQQVAEVVRIASVLNVQPQRSTTA